MTTAELLLIAAHDAPVGVPHRDRIPYELAIRFCEAAFIAMNLDRSGTGIRWGEPARTTINAMFTAKTKDAAARPAFESLKAKCVRLALILTTDPALVPDCERDSLLGLLDVAIANPPARLGIGKNTIDATLPLAKRLRAALIASAPESAEPPAGDGPVEFAFAWSRQTRSGKTVPQRHVGRGETTLERVSAEDAPVFATLRRPDGGELEMRRIDGVPYRPVLSPDLWTPLGEGAFRAAARDGVAWRDCPFRDRPQAESSAMALDEYCSTPPTKDDETERAAAREAIVKAGRLVVVDGVVYRRTEEPELIVAATQLTTGLGSGPTGSSKSTTYDRRIEVAWRLGGDLASIDNQATIVSSSQRRPLYEAGVYSSNNQNDNWYARCAEVPNLIFPLGEYVLAESAAQSFSDHVGLPFTSASPVVSIADFAAREAFDPARQLRAIRRAASNRSVCGGVVRDGKAAAESGLAAFESGDPVAAEAASDLLDAFASTYYDHPSKISAAYAKRLIGSGPLEPFDARLAVLAEVASTSLRSLAAASNDEDEDIAAFSVFHP